MNNKVTILSETTCPPTCPGRMFLRASFAIAIADCSNGQTLARAAQMGHGVSKAVALTAQGNVYCGGDQRYVAHGLVRINEASLR
jgi:hypothetical protein